MGIVGTHPGDVRKSGKQRTYRIRNLEECTENGRERRQGERRMGWKNEGEDGERESHGKIASASTNVK